MAYGSPDNITRFVELIQWSNGVVDNLLGIFLLFTIATVSFVTTVWKTEASNAFTFSMILTSISAMFLKIFGIVDGYVLFFCFMLTGLGLVITSKSRSYY